MVAVRITRQGVEVGALGPSQAAITRLNSEVAVEAQGATTGTVRVTRQVVEVLGRGPRISNITRLDAEVAVVAQAASTGSVAVSRISVEVGILPVKRANLTRLNTEVAVVAQAASSGSVRVTRIAAELLARRGASGLVVPLSLATGIEVFLHNWVDFLTLRTSYSTDVATSPTTGGESRRSLMNKPNREMDLLWHNHAVTDAEVARMDRLLVMLRKLTDQRIAIPLYCDQKDLDSAYLSSESTLFFDTSKGRWFPGARVVVVQLDMNGSYESHSFHRITTMQDDRINLDTTLGAAVKIGSVVMPMIDCEVLLEAKAKYNTARNIQIKLTVKEVPGVSQLPPVKSDMPSNAQVFDDAPIFDIDPDWITGIEKGRIRHGQEYSQGRANRVYTSSARSREWHKYNLTGMRGDCAPSHRFDVWRAVEFFDTRRGRARSYWHIDQEQVWTATSIDASGNFVGVNEINDLASFAEELEDEWVGLVMKDGTMYVRPVVTVQQVLTVFRITVSPALPAGLNVADVVRVARARRSRFDQDEIEERWSNAGYMATSLQIIETLEEKNIEL